MPIVIIFLLIFIIGLVIYVGTHGIANVRAKEAEYSESKIKIAPMLEPKTELLAVSTRNSPVAIIDPYGPPLRNDGVFFPRDSADIRGTNTLVVNEPKVCAIGVPINIETRDCAHCLPREFTQVGILSRGSGRGDQVLTLMGRRLMLGSDKWQYYTLTNSGIMPTKVSVYSNGRDAMGEYGVDRLCNGDNVFVDGYEEVYRAKMYENSTFRYIPFI